MPCIPCIGQLASLLAIETIPSPSIKLPVEVINEFSVNEVYKGVANITRVIVVHGKIQEVNFHFIVSAYLLIEHSFFCKAIFLIIDTTGRVDMVMWIDGGIFHACFLNNTPKPKRDKLKIS